MPRHHFEQVLSAPQEGARRRLRHGADGGGPGRRRRGRTRPSSASRPASRFPGRSARAALGRDRRGLQVLGQRAGEDVPQAAQHPRRLGHGRQRAGDGLRKPRRDVRDGRRLHARSRRPARRGSTASSCRTRRARTSWPASARRGRSTRDGSGISLEETMPRGVRRAPARAGPAREALPRHAGPRVHDRGAQALPAPDAQRQAHRLRGRAGRDRHGGRGADLGGGGALARRAGAARPAPRARLRREGEGRGDAAAGRLLGKGLPAGPGAASGRIAFTARRAVEMAAEGKPVVLVRDETSPEDIAGMHAAVGILTTRGGMTSHAAVVARGMGKTCVVGAGEITVDEARKQVRAKNLQATEGDWISIDGTTGEVILGPAADAAVGGPPGRAREVARAGEVARLPRVRPDPRPGPTSAGASASAPTPTRRPTRGSPSSSARRGSVSAAPSTCSSRRSASSRCAR